MTDRPFFFICVCFFFLNVTEEVLPASWKFDLHGDEKYVLAESSDDIFQQQVVGGENLNGGFDRVAKRLFNSA